MLEHIWQKALVYLVGLTKIQIFVGVMLLASVLGLLDYLTGAEISIALFFIFPITIATWFINPFGGLTLAVYGLFLWWLSDRVHGDVYSSGFVYYWSMGNRGAFLVLIVWAVYLLKKNIDKAYLLARTDPLTGVLNSREFFRVAELELVRAARRKDPVTIAYLDLDNFKQINNEYGHREGDALLKFVAESIESSLRCTDICARLGGDEFAIILPATDKAAAEVVVQKVQKILLDKMKERGSRVSFSLGAVSCIGGSCTVSDILHLTDAMMYRCKRRGKNRFVVVDFDKDGIPDDDHLFEHRFHRRQIYHSKSRRRPDHRPGPAV